MCICGTTKAYSRLALRSAATWTFIMAGVHTRVLTAARPIKPTSPRCHSAWQPNPGRGSTYRGGKSVQTTGTTSLCRRAFRYFLHVSSYYADATNERLPRRHQTVQQATESGT